MSLLFALLVLAAPTSQPASQPAAPLPSERVVDDAKLRFHFAVPKQWKQVEQKVDAVVYVFQLPATGDSRRYMPSLIITARDLKDRDLAAEVDGRRKAIQAHNPDAKFTEDAAAQPGGHDGWTFAYDTKLKQTVTSNGNSHEEQIAVKVRDQIIAIDGRAIEFVLSSDEKGLPIRMKLIERVQRTLKVDP